MRRDERVANTGESLQCLFNLGEVQPATADLHKPTDATEQREFAVCVEPPNVGHPM